MTRLNPVIERLEADPERLRANWSLPREDARFLYLLARASGCRALLEVGTSIGYSTLHLALAASCSGGSVTTIDTSAERQAQAQAHLKEAGLAQYVQCVHGDALSQLQALQTEGRTFDLMFIDARKSEYLRYAQLAERLLASGGILLADNTRSHREQMQDFIDYMAHSPRWESCDLETPNGWVFARKTEDIVEDQT